MARFRDPRLTNLTGSSDDGSWVIEGGTLSNPQPTFSGDPLFTGHYTVIGNLCHFAIDVDMDNILTFGTGQYYMKLPFASNHNIVLSDGCLHDDSTGNQYAILGHVVEGSDIMTLFSIGSNGQHIPFSDSDNQPIKLQTVDSFHIAGNFEIDNA